MSTDDPCGKSTQLGSVPAPATLRRYVTRTCAYADDMSRRRFFLPALLVLAVTAAACSSDSSVESQNSAEDASTTTTEALPPPTGAESDLYADLTYWHCHPDKADDVCDTTPLDTDEVLPDGSLATVAHEPAADPPIDCFYVYPTVDYSDVPGNRSFDEPINPLEPVTIGGQFARFSEVCRPFAPRYEQMTIGGYQDDNVDDMLAHARGQVTEAFQHYLATENDGRPFVLIGHSQGSHHLAQMLADDVDDDPATHNLLLSALLIGPTGRVQVPEGDVVGGTFDNIELCTTASQTGCVIAYDSYSTDQQPQRAPADDTVSACVNPAGLNSDRSDADSASALDGSYFGANTEGVDTRFELWANYYTAECTTADSGEHYLEIAAAPPDGDARTELAISNNAGQSLHILDINFGLRDLIEIVRLQSGQ